MGAATPPDLLVNLMKSLVPIPLESAEKLKKEKQTRLGYQFISIKLKDGRYFEQAVASEGCIIQIKGQKDIPFTEADVESVELSDRPWNFRRPVRVNRKTDVAQ
ncbi:MAG TPA: hypothetical protein VFR42_02570 [Candidatus Acidoferrum sp.]|nr:hypothetical protein [Candidatus Acidoferrum sp.]